MWRFCDLLLFQFSEKLNKMIFSKLPEEMTDKHISITTSCSHPSKLTLDIAILLFRIVTDYKGMVITYQEDIQKSENHFQLLPSF